ncbi:flagellar basal body rod protein FlgB [Bdellovibrio svalbardensis]|uniref:Flagellar basal body rod protein FlgB n=1 Tax=Bdellovibrio svalbardensis TaxID=2972972 RepID=A0ABT6DEY8_9BACT|nr:flagellar basal body rod protein FlgB [Bdellovibrio svalbardensis]MDG0815353.1 flagellar basal body rod protein FlgB [Bdellovibrio svalbardensis]
MSGDLFDKTTNALATSMRMRQLRHNVTSSNIANAETPGYHAKKMDFEEALGRALDMDGANGLSTSSKEHFAVGGVSVAKTRPDIYENPEGAVNNDGNTVDLEKEMSALSENAIMYKTALQLINKKMAALKYAAGDGR